MVAEFPVAKLLYLAVRQLGKPIANFFKERAKSSSFFRNYICIPPAQLHHWYDTRLKMQALGLGKPKAVTKLNPEQAVDTGATILGEAVIYLIAAATIIAEYQRQSRRDSAKEELAKQRVEDLVNSVHELTMIAETNAAQLRELERRIHAKKR
ncbi:hypothetical protein BOX15_Mlig003668g2 [Macrostomum lignano]|uniref:OPA3-like protein n=1 Tax=Macrostomum lignano TaxID=282301 RepID=A0A267DPV9_9PLAT|nr:hypothetical protein BOX15_Mlig003668g2 [Macrostomum lignano]